MRSFPSACALAVTLAVAHVASAAPDTYAPAQTPPPPAFYAGYSQPIVTSSFVARSPTLRAIGVGLIIAGGLALVAAPIVASASTSPAGDPTAPASTDGAVVAVALSGLGLIAVGIPLTVYGSTLVPPPPKKPALRIEPGPLGLRISF